MDISIRLLLLLAFCCILRCSIADDAQQQRSVMVVGTVYCDTCFQQQFSKASHFISGSIHLYISDFNFVEIALSTLVTNTSSIS